MSGEGFCASAPADQALVSDQAAARLDPSGFDPSRERGITVGKSWPRPATPCNLAPRWEGEFRDHADWVNFATKRLTVATDSNGRDLSAICVDAFGRRCANGRDMARARDEGAFPVRYFWDCWPAGSDSDGSPKGGDGEAGSVRSTTARAEGIAEPDPAILSGKEPAA